MNGEQTTMAAEQPGLFSLNHLTRLGTKTPAVIVFAANPADAAAQLEDWLRQAAADPPRPGDFAVFDGDCFNLAFGEFLAAACYGVVPEQPKAAPEGHGGNGAGPR